jgi:hypothetical protein
MSIVPALWWGIPVVLSLSAQLLLLVANRAAVCASENKTTQAIPWLRGQRMDTGVVDSTSSTGRPVDFETRLRITEMALGIIWVYPPPTHTHLSSPLVKLSRTNNPS